VSPPDDLSAAGVILGAAGACLLAVADAGKRNLATTLSPLPAAWITVLIGALGVWGALALTGIPVPVWGDLWGVFLLCGVLALAGEILFLRGARDTDFSVGMPLLSIIPVCSLLLGIVFYGHLPGGLALGGIMLVFAGGYLLGVKLPLRDNVWAPVRLLFADRGCRSILGAAIIAALIFALQQPLVDRSSPLFFFGCLLAFQAVGFSGLMMWRREPLGREITSRLPFILGVSLLWAAGLGCTFASHALMLKAYSSSILQLKGVLAVLIGCWWFGEEGFRQRLGAVVLMLLGVITIIQFG